MEYSRATEYLCKLPYPDLVSTIRNPSCGDQLGLSLQISDGVILHISFEHKGCLISSACAAVLCENIMGKSISVLKQQSPRELLNFNFEQLTPRRRRCATLATELLSQMLRDYQLNQSDN
ncbi:iron-sulfur cluster assembly scaffold protein [Rubinisphaera italica]|uniref:iron-sulfur cluster assembly scaffold protein n=1 Tax=Rubinisphaera italica TaxID=2527969 RepID=UPI0011B7469F|nr:iron-sulfur cluster assembly scaffold protein [Rubinisphaera italica]